MAIGSPQWMYSSGSADYEIDQSLKFSNHLGRKSYLAWTPGTATNQKIWTLSYWAKSNVDSTGNNYMLSTGTSGTQNDTIHWRADGYWDFGSYSSGYTHQLRTNAAFRDPSAWYHFLIAFDTTQSTEANRIKMYVNGVDQSDTNVAGGFSITNYPSLNSTDGHTNHAELHQIGKSVWSDGGYLGAYLAEYHFVDGQALTPADFGETGDYGEWKPIEYSGTYGTNGFYLPFNQDYSVEGFSAVTYSGNGVNGQYIGGTGFKPGFTWIKERSSSSSHQLHDQVRGAGNAVYIDDTGQEDYSSTTLQAFNNDGFTVGSHGAVNASGDTYVAWNWDMGTSNPACFVTAGGGAQHSTSENKIGSSSIAFDGSGDYLTIPDAADLNFGSGDFTIEFWIKVSGVSSNPHIIVFSDDVVGWYIFINTDGSLHASLKGVTGTATGITDDISDDAWHHIALERDGSNFKYYLDGTVFNSSTTFSGTIPDYSGVLRLGGWTTSTYMLTGYMDEIRISNTARYKGNFTPATTAFTDDDNTLLLIHSNTSDGSTTFTDSSGTAINTDGTIDSRVKANTTYGQSIVSYSGNATAGATVGHGLSSAPDMIIIKHRENNGESGRVYHSGVTDGHLGYLNSNGVGAWADETLSAWNDTAPTSSVFSIGSDTAHNASGNGFVAYCFHDVTGYSSFGSYTGNGNATGPSVTTGFKPAFVLFKRTDSASSWTILDNARTPINPIDDHIRAQTNDSEMTSDPASIADFTSTGFQIKTATDANDWNTSGGTYIYAAFADKREAAFWLDQSGNNNDWTSNNLTESDIMVDSPTNNFCTLNPLDAAANCVLSEGNLKYTTDHSTQTLLKSTFNLTNKHYWEFVISGVGGNASAGDVGIGNPSALSTDGEYATWADNTLIYRGTNGTARDGFGGSLVSYGASFTTGDIIGIALDVPSGTIQFFKNNSSQGTITDSTITAQGNANTLLPVVSNNSTSGSRSFIANFGQDSSFAGNKTAQGNQDSNDIGDFYYTPPTDFLALCTSNLPDPTVTPSEHFNTLLYTGDGSSGLAITGVGFQPDFTWIKKRSGSGQHVFADVLRSDGTYPKTLNSNSTAAEDVNSDGEMVRSLDTDGFTLGDSQAGQGDVNYTDGGTYVSWNWKAGTSVSGTTTGSGTGKSYTGSVNADAGFSIIGYEGNGTNGHKIYHHLNEAPEMVIIKNRESATNWGVYHYKLADTQGIKLNDSQGATTENWYQNTDPTSTIVELRGASTVNENTKDHIAYCFHSVDGYSKVGSYTGNGSTDGTFVYTGFRPAYVLIKRSSSGEGWYVKDIGRNPNGNPVHNSLSPHDTSVEFSTHSSSHSSCVDFLSNGFKLRGTDTQSNDSGSTFIYLAFAESPFKHTNAR